MDGSSIKIGYRCLNKDARKSGFSENMFNQEKGQNIPTM
jgi:hypothetical protein